MPVNSACAVFCFGPGECEHKRRDREEREHLRRLELAADKFTREAGAVIEPRLLAGTAQVLGTHYTEM